MSINRGGEYSSPESFKETRQKLYDQFLELGSVTQTKWEQISSLEQVTDFADLYEKWADLFTKISLKFEDDTSSFEELAELYKEFVNETNNFSMMLPDGSSEMNDNIIN